MTSTEVFSSFSRKRSKKHRRLGCQTFGEADPGGLGACPQEKNWSNSLLFLEKEAKSTRSWAVQPSAKPTLGFGGLPQEKNWSNCLLFLEEEAKSTEDWAAQRSAKPTQGAWPQQYGDKKRFTNNDLGLLRLSQRASHITH
jgi:hypothetical protein